MTKKRKFKKPFEKYGERNGYLRGMGFKSYHGYLQSSLWRQIRKMKLEDEPNCELCDQQANQVHHLSYTRPVLAGARLDQLLSVCRDCHIQIELDKKGKKKSWGASRATTYKLLRHRGKDKPQRSSSESERQSDKAGHKARGETSSEVD